MSKKALIPLHRARLNELKDIDDVRPLSEADLPVLKAIRDVLEQHRALDRFGITLLHKHFDLAPGEELFEIADVAQRTLTIKPVMGTKQGRSMETAWRFDSQNAGDTPSMFCFVKCRWKPGSSEHSGIQDHDRS